jgi:hypothetical protein
LGASILVDQSAKKQQPTALRTGAHEPDAETGTTQTAQIDASAEPALGFLNVAEKANDLEGTKKAVDEAASVGGGLWLSYLFVLFYLAVAAGAVTHADLFLENPVKLPFLNIELPLLAFFFLAPILFTNHSRLCAYASCHALAEGETVPSSAA